MFLRFERDTRYYLLKIEKDLFGAWMLVRTWGGIHSKRGSEMKESFLSYDDAMQGLEYQVKIRNKKRYEVVI